MKYSLKMKKLVTNFHRVHPAKWELLLRLKRERWVILFSSQQRKYCHYFL